MEEALVKRDRSRETNMSDARPQGLAGGQGPQPTKYSKTERKKRQGRRRKISSDAVLGESKTEGKGGQMEFPNVRGSGCLQAVAQPGTRRRTGNYLFKCK